MSMEKIVIRKAREHNLKEIDVEIPRDKLVVITGLSGSGKSSLAFDTIYAEGQRRYMESLSAYARQFLPQMDKPDVDSIEGLSPAIAIEQKTTHRNPRSTVGTVTEIYDYLRVLFARIGKPICYNCGEPIYGQSVQEMVDQILELPEKTKFSILAPIIRSRKGEYRKELKQLLREGYTRVRIDGEIHYLEEEIELDRHKKHDIDLIIDRLSIREGIKNRLTDSIERGLDKSNGLIRVLTQDGQEWLMSEHHACLNCNISYPEISPRIFSFNAPQGACPSCSGLGFEHVIDEHLLIPDKKLSFAEGALAPWGKMKESRIYQVLEEFCEEEGIDFHTPFEELPEDFRRRILYGSKKKSKRYRKSRWKGWDYVIRYDGLIPTMQRWFHESDSEQRKEELGRYMKLQACEECGGARLKRESLHILVGGKNIAEISAMPIGEAIQFFEELSLSKKDAFIARRLLKEIRERLQFLVDVGVDYLTLDRTAGTLSGGESQRIRLATQIGTALVGVLYILDEPSIGLHPRDNHRLLRTLQRLRDLGNSVIVVEHDEETMRYADQIIDMGPGAGIHGGRVVAQGKLEELFEVEESLTGQFLSGRRSIPIPTKRRIGHNLFLELKNAHHNNLKNIDVSIPLGTLTCITGVSGSGKSSLIIDTLYRYCSFYLHGSKGRIGSIDEIRGLEHIDKVINIDQAPIGRTPRSNPATYIDLFTPIRNLFAQLPESRARGYKAGRFSFNVKGGRCSECEGAGTLRIEMHFLPDVFVTCEACKGQRFNRETLEILYKGKTIADVLQMTVEEALDFFQNIPVLKRKLTILRDVGLGYISLGQPATTLSGGEAQRIKLAKELSKRSTGKTLYILDEPTTGLHLADIEQLLQVLHHLVDEGNTVLVIEHQLDVLKTADWIIDLGPEGGDAGGQIVTCGTPEEIANHPTSYTGQFLKKTLNNSL